jgi:hypothetical protein
VANDIDLDKFYTTAVYQYTGAVPYNAISFDKLYTTAIYQYTGTNATFDKISFDKLYTTAIYQYTGTDATFDKISFDKLYTQAIYRRQNLVGLDADPYFNYVVLLCGFDGTDASTTFIDESGYQHTLTAVGNAQIDTAQSKFGVSSALFDGNSDRITSPDSSEWHFGSGPFTIECFARFRITETAANVICSQWASSSRSFVFDYFNGDIRFSYSTDGTAVTQVTLTFAWTQSGGTWFHLAVSRDGSGNIRVFVDGTQIGSTTAAAVTFFNSTASLWIGAIETSTPTNDFDGWIDELRITKGVARYTSNFTAPTQQFPRWFDVLTSAVNVSTTLTGQAMTASVGTVAITTDIDATASVTSPAMTVSVGAATAFIPVPRRSQLVQFSKRWPLIIWSDTPPTTATAGTPYAGFQAYRIGGAPPIVFSLYGTWPAGITIDSMTGVVSGTPTVSGTYSGLSVRATDHDARTANTAAFALMVAAVSATANVAGQSIIVSVGDAIGFAPANVTGLVLTTAVGTVTVDAVLGFVDPYLGSVTLLCGFDGADAVTTFIDESPFARPLLRAGNAQLDTAQSKFGTASLLLDGTGDYITAADSTDWTLAAGQQFTFELWARWNADPAAFQILLGQWYTSGSQKSWEIDYDSSANNMRLDLSSDGATTTGVILAAFTPTLATWYHIAADFDGTKYRLYINGTMIGSSTTLITPFNATSLVTIGAQQDGSFPFNGWIDEVRITKDYARYASDSGFTVQTTQHPRTSTAGTARITQEYAEAVAQFGTSTRVTQEYVEAVAQWPTTVRVTQTYTEAIVRWQGTGRVTQLNVEVIAGTVTAPARITQNYTEVITSGVVAPARITQTYVEVIRSV